MLNNKHTIITLPIIYPNKLAVITMKISIIDLHDINLTHFDAILLIQSVKHLS